MVMPKDSFQMEAQVKLLEGWRDHTKSLEESLDMLEKGIDEAAVMTDVCTPEWCVATEQVMDELANRMYSISEPPWSSEEDSRKLKILKRRLHDVYTKYKAVLKKGA
jgi:hypothetical protein